MSSRAIRKAQRQLAGQSLPSHDSLNPPERDEEDEDSIGAKAKPNPFALLDESNDDGGEEASSETGDVDEAQDLGSSEHGRQKSGSVIASSKGKRKKKRERGKGRGPVASGDNRFKTGKSDLSTQADGTYIDDIDVALSSPAIKTQDLATRQPSFDDALVTSLCALLAINLQNLNAANEMRRLFGRAALGPNNDDQTENRAGRRRGREERRHDLAGAVAGHDVAGGKGLLGLSLRRNVFIPGKEEWPRATTGGLGMEVVRKGHGGVTEYRFVHSRSYQDVQRQFQTCVASMDPNRMIQLLQFNPYHISTLLQVSDIAKHERDHATAGDLLERALFSFGRAVHSTFANHLSQAKARLDFNRPENREFWLAAWRYITNLGMRGTWKTAYEWAKVLLSIDPEGDHYCIRLIIDQLALRSGQAQELINLASSTHFSTYWSNLPNMQASLALAQQQQAEQDLCWRTLFSAVKNYPWLFNRLFQELQIKRIPPSVWGSEPRTAHEQLLSEVYVRGAIDLWKVPEATSLLIEVTGISPQMLPPKAPDPRPITLDEARHVILTDNPALIALLPYAITSLLESSSDPLLPPQNLASYGTDVIPDDVSYGEDEELQEDEEYSE